MGKRKRSAVVDVVGAQRLSVRTRFAEKASDLSELEQKDQRRLAGRLGGRLNALKQQVADGKVKPVEVQGEMKLLEELKVDAQEQASQAAMDARGQLKAQWRLAGAAANVMLRNVGFKQPFSKRRR